MADTYGVVATDVSAELPGLFTGGFTQATKPSLAEVTRWITTADVAIGLVVKDVTGTTPLVSDKAAVLAKEYVIAWVKAKVMAAVYAGKVDPTAMAGILQSAYGAAKDIRLSLIEMGTQAAGTGEASPRLAVPYTTPQRCLIVEDSDLDPASNRRGRV